MYSIEKTLYGFKIVFEGFLKSEEMRNWVKDSEKALSSMRGAFGVLVDARELEPLPLDSQTILKKGQILYNLKGMERSVLIFNNDVIKVQFLDPAHKIAIHRVKRNINATENPKWEEAALSWIIDSVEPLVEK